MILLTDADVDGYHVSVTLETPARPIFEQCSADAMFCVSQICGLLFAYFQHYFPSLLASGFMKRMLTPVIVATKRAERHEFFDIPSFDRWSNGTNLGSWRIKYLKGLGSSRREDAVGYFERIQNYLKPVVVDENTPERVDMLFSNKRADDRKEWLLRRGDDMDLDYAAPTQCVTRVLDTELKQFSYETLRRAIPSLVDGLKESARKLVWAGLQKFKPGVPEMKIAQFASFCAERSAYLHGEKSLCDAVTRMTQEFPGANNLAFFQPRGQTGSRLQNGADAASPRYTYTALSPFTRLIFDERDSVSLTTRHEEGLEIEPEFFCPILPTALVNGIEGISVGFRSSIPQFSPDDLIDNLFHKMDTGTFKPMVPWARGWHGEVKENGHWDFIGKYRMLGTKCHIDEIPLGVSTDKFHAHLMKLADEEKSGVNKVEAQHPDENSVHWVLYVDSKFDPEKSLNLTRSISKKCLNLLDRDGIIRTFESIDEILEAYFSIRMEFYQKRKDAMLRGGAADLSEMNHKITFIQAVLDTNILVRAKKSVIIEQTRALGIPAVLAEKFVSMSILSLSAEKVEELQKRIDDLTRTLDVLRSKSPESLYKADLRALRTALRKAFPEPASASAAGGGKKRTTGGMKPKAKRAKK